MHQFTVLPEAFKELQKAIFIRILFVGGLVLLVVFILPIILSDGSAEISISTWLTLALMSVVLGFTFYSSMKKQKAMLATYKLIITEENVRREMMNMPTIEILKKDIREIKKGVSGAITIIGDSKLNAIGVPSHIENKDELEQLLNAIHPLTVNVKVSWIQRFQYPIVIGFVALMFSVYYMKDKYFSTLAGVVFSGVMIYSFIITQKSKNVDIKMKRLSYWMLVPLLSVIGAVIMKWVG